MESNIGLIGYGHLGKSLVTGAEKAGLEIGVSKGRGKNAEVTENADLIVLTVKPGQVLGVLDEIRGHTKANAEVLSFAAALSSGKIRKGTQARVSRAMTDINLEQIILTQGNNPNALDFCRTVSQNPVIQSGERDVDAFTVYVGCLPGVAAWQYCFNAEDSDRWLAGYLAHIEDRIKVPVSVTGRIVADIKAKGNYADTVTRVATPNGVTAALVRQLELNSNVDYEYLYDYGYDRIETINNGI